MKQRQTTKRDPRGRFAPGNPGGPGRPPRATEAAYLLTIADAVDLEAWRAIVERAAQDAKDGDDRARRWLAGYLLQDPKGENAKTLGDLAAYEALGITPEVLAMARALDVEGKEPLFDFGGGATGIYRARDIAEAIAADAQTGDE